MSKEQYSKLVQLRDEMFNKDHEDNPDLPRDDGSFPIVELESEPLPKYPFGPYFNELSIILESKIFQDGQLKGRQLSGNARKYRSYQINDLEEFIWLLCDTIHKFSPVDTEQSAMDSLLNLLKYIEECNATIRRLFGKIQGDKIAAFGEKLKTSLSTMMESSKKSSPPFFITERYLTDHITDLFMKHIPDAPEETISVGVYKLLEMFGIKCNPKTLTMRQYRKRKALPEK
jgi:hypothetical protein